METTLGFLQHRILILEAIRLGDGGHHTIPATDDGQESLQLSLQCSRGALGKRVLAEVAFDGVHEQWICGRRRWFGCRRRGRMRVNSSIDLWTLNTWYCPVPPICFDLRILILRLQQPPTQPPELWRVMGERR